MSKAGKNAAVEAIKFALEADDGLTFLRLWNQGDFDKTRREWPEAPEAVYIGADPLHPDTAKASHQVDAGDALAKLADVTNELCVALGTSLIGVDVTKLDFQGKFILARREDCRRELAQHGY
jgi:hypothetical protein